MDRVELPAADGRRSIKSFVLRGSRLATYQLEALERFSDHYVIPFSDTPVSFENLFGNTHPTIVEIGFGMGHSTERIARDRSEYNYLGIEVFLNGFTKLLHAIGTSELEHVRLIRFDAVEVVKSMITNGSVAGFHIFFPDPWPKKKHHKRRLIQPDFVKLLTQKLAEHGYIYCVTDWEAYAEHMLSVFSQEAELQNPYDGYAPSRSWRPQTSFERKGIEKSHPIREVWVEKVSRG